MKKIAVGVGIAVVVLVAAALAAPSFIDWTRYRDPIAKRISALTGREVRIGGAISFRILPEPRLEVGDVRLANLPGGSAPDMVQMKSLTVRVALLPLLGGRIAVESVALIKPVVRLEVLADGRQNWMLRPASAAARGATPPGGVAGLGAVRLDSVSVQDGTVIYSAGPGKKPLRFDKIDARLRATTLAGPYHLRGKLVASGTPLAFRVNLGRWTPDHQAPVLAHLDLTKSNAHLSADGVIFGAFGADRFNGSVKAEGENFASLIQTLGGVRAPRLDLPFKLDFQATGDKTAVSLNDIGFQFGGNAMTGAATVAFTPTGPRIDATLAVGYLNLDSFLTRAGSLRAGAGKATAPSTNGGATSGAVRAAAFPYRIPTGFSASLDLRVSVASFHGGILRDMRLAGSLDNGQLTIRRLGALLPGASTISLTGIAAASQGQPQFSGQLTVASADMRALLGWLGVDTQRVPPGRLTIFSARVPFTATPETLTADQIDVHLDQSHLTGTGTINLAGRPAAAFDLALDRIDLDDYLSMASGHLLPTAATAGDGGAATRAGGTRPWALPISFATLMALDTELKLRVGEVVYRVVPISGITLNLATKDGGLDLEKFQIANAGGASLVLSGSASDVTGKASYQGTVALKAPSLGVFARLGGFAPPSSWMMLRGLKVASKVSGDTTGATLSGVDVALGPDEAGGDIEIRFTKPRPQIRANLTVTNLWLDPFLASGGASSAAPGTVPGAASGAASAGSSGVAPAAKPIWSEQPFNLGPLVWVDGIAALNAKQITVRGYRIQNAEITATLNDGTLTLNPIRALLFGGALAAKVHVSSGVDPALEASFAWQDVDLHRLLFGMTGLGALSGQGTLNGALRSKGASPAAIIGNLAGNVIVSATTGAIEGIDLARLSSGLGKLKEAKDVIALSDAALSGGTTPIRVARGTWLIAKGIARTEDTTVAFPGAEATLKGSLDFPSGSMALTSAIQLTSPGGAPPLSVTLSGPIHDPTRQSDTAALERYVAAAAAARQIKEGPLKGPSGELKKMPARVPSPKKPALPAPNSKVPTPKSSPSEAVRPQPLSSKTPADTKP